VLIERDHTTATYVAASVLALGFALAQPAALAGADPVQAPHFAMQSIVVSLVTASSDASYPTHARTVGDFLRERGISVAPDDYVSQPLDATLSPGTRITYRPAVTLTFVSAGERIALRTAAPTVAALLAERDLRLGPDDEVVPAQDATLAEGSVVRIVRVSHITKTLVQTLAPPVQRRFDASLTAGRTRTIEPGLTGLRETTVSIERRDDGTPPRRIEYARTVREPRAKVVAVGTAPRFRAIAAAAGRGLDAAARIANSALRMVATAYTAGCYGCSGITALGFHAGHGIVAVDPSVIPLGTKLYVPGYGKAIAGDTGGDIHGRRIDLGFNNLADAMRFGRREITVYVLR
jgi:3D (Asp-Asp-Asp) domain-containing protein